MKLVIDLSDSKVGDTLYTYYLCRNGKNKNKILCRKAIVMDIYADVLALHIVSDKDNGQTLWNSLNISKFSGKSVTKDAMYHIVFKAPNDELARKYIVSCMEYSLRKKANKLLQDHKCYIDVIHKNERGE